MDEIETLKAQIEFLKKRIDELELNNGSLSDCIRDGLELNYASWIEWYAVARGIYEEHAINPNAVDPARESLEIYLKHMRRHAVDFIDTIVKGTQG